MIGYVVAAVRWDTSVGVTMRESDIELDRHNIAVSREVLFPLKAQQSFMSGRRQRPTATKRLVGHHLGSDKALLQVAMDGPGRSLRIAIRFLSGTSRQPSSGGSGQSCTRARSCVRPPLTRSPVG